MIRLCSNLTSSLTPPGSRSASSPLLFYSMASTRFRARQRNLISKVSSQPISVYPYIAGCIFSGRFSSGHGGSSPKRPIFELGRRHWTQRIGIGRYQMPIIGGRRFGSLLYRLGLDIWWMACVASDYYDVGACLRFFCTSTHCTYSAADEGRVTVRIVGNQLMRSQFGQCIKVSLLRGRQHVSSMSCTSYLRQVP